MVVFDNAGERIRRFERLARPLESGRAFQLLIKIGFGGGNLGRKINAALRAESLGHAVARRAREAEFPQAPPASAAKGTGQVCARAAVGADSDRAGAYGGALTRYLRHSFLGLITLGARYCWTPATHSVISVIAF